MRFFIILLICAACGDEPPAPAKIELPLLDLQQANMGIQAFNAGRALQARGQFTQAEQAYRQALKGAPSHPQYHYYLGVALHAQSRFTEAQKQFEKALEIKPDYAGPHIALGKMLYDVHGMVSEARELLTTALQLAPEATEARYILGLIHQREGQWPEAINIFSAIVAADTSHLKARTQLGLAHLQQGDYPQAERELRQVIRLNPHEPAAFLGLGQTLSRSSKEEEGQRFIERARILGEQNTQLKPHHEAMLKYPNQPKAHSNLAALYNRFGRLKLAAEHYHQSIRIDSTYGPGYQGLGNMYQRRGKDALAARYYLEALRWDSTLAESHNNLGLLLHGKGELEKSIQQYEKAVQLAPDVGFYISNLGHAYLEAGELDRAKTAADRAIAKNPSLVSAHILLGDVYARQDDFAQALKQWQAIPAIAADNERLRAKITDAQQRLAAQAK